MDKPNNEIPIMILLKVMKQLRDPIKGCEWDKSQTWQTILPYTLEEVYEVADAVDNNDSAGLQDELGDLLFQVVFMAQIAAEQGLFDFDAVVRGITEKMVRRHPHVFAKEKHADEQSQQQNWEKIKQEERQQKDTAQNKQATFFSGISATLPALRRSQKIQKRAANVGFDWENWQQVMPKIQEELQEVEEAIAQQESFERIEEEVGDVIMATTNLARLLNVDAENALRLANRKFEQRFLRVEALLAEQHICLEQATLAQMDQAWEQAKKEQKKEKHKNTPVIHRG